MKSRERIITTLAHQQPDRCATYIWISAETMDLLTQHLGVQTHDEVEDALKIDKWREINLEIERPPEYYEMVDSLVPEEYKGNPCFYIAIDGRVVKIHQQADYLEDAVFFPLEKLDRLNDLDLYPFPKPEWIKIPADLEESIEEYKQQGCFVTSGEIPQLFKAAWMLRGMHNVLMDYLVNPELLREIHRRNYAFYTEYCSILLKAGVEMIKIVGDLGMQEGLMMSPDAWRAIDKEPLREFINTMKGINPEVKMYMHTDGQMQDIIEDIIEIGIDVLNPIQPECMDPVETKKRYGRSLVLHGAVSLQKTLPFGTPEDVKNEVRHLIEHCNVGGGFVIGPSNVLFKEVPMENIVAMYEAVY